MCRRDLACRIEIKRVEEGTLGYKEGIGVGKEKIGGKDGKNVGDGKGRNNDGGNKGWREQFWVQRQGGQKDVLGVGFVCTCLSGRRRNKRRGK